MGGGGGGPEGSILDGIRCSRDAEPDVAHGDDRVHKRNGVDGKDLSRFIVRDRHPDSGTCDERMK